MFCTRWNGLEKGSIFDDALDDKEYEGNLIYLLKSGSEFIRNNSKVRFVKEAQYRVDKPDYAERAVTEALVNALIHRDYIVLGSEIHIDMFDDRGGNHISWRYVWRRLNSGIRYLQYSFDATKPCDC